MFDRNKKKFLRKKSALLHDYALFGIISLMIGITFNKYNKRVNPSEIDPKN